jgi:hypothetical protein
LIEDYFDFLRAHTVVLFADARVYKEYMRIWTMYQAPREGFSDLFAIDTLDSIFTKAMPFDIDRVDQVAIDAIS